MELREKRALAYTITAFNIALLRGGAFFTYIATSPDREEEARDAVLRELTRLKTERPMDSELKMAKAFSRGSHAISLQGNMAIAAQYIHQHFAGRSLETLSKYDERIESVTGNEVRAVADSVVDLGQYALGIVRGTQK